jgi:hypothetical protein
MPQHNIQSSHTSELFTVLNGYVCGTTNQIIIIFLTQRPSKKNLTQHMKKFQVEYLGLALSHHSIAFQIANINCYNCNEKRHHIKEKVHKIGEYVKGS